jgi:hypothetical protein
MNRRQAPGASPEPAAPGADRPPPLEAEVRAEDLGANAPEDTQDTTTDVEATPGEGENAPGFLKQRKR